MDEQKPNISNNVNPTPNTGAPKQPAGFPPRRTEGAPFVRRPFGGVPRTPGRPFFGNKGPARDFSKGEEGGDRRPFKKNPRRAPGREQRAKPEFDQKIIDIRRVARVVSGGRRFSFSVTLVAGDKKGKVGVGMGKAGDTSMAIDKAMRDAKKNMIKINTTKDMSIAHDVEAKFCSSEVLIMPAPNRGTIAGSSVRNVIELAGLKNIVAKLMSGSKNKINNAKVAVKALSLVRPPRQQSVSAKAVSEIKK